MNIYTLIPKIMSEVGFISKDRTNPSQGYKFRGVDDVFLALQGPLASNGVFFCTNVLSETKEERTSKSGGLLIYTTLKIEFTFFAADGSSIKVVTIGEGMDSGDKSSNKAMSAAVKYALLHLFCIPTEDAKDPENEEPDPLPKNNNGEPKSLIKTKEIIKIASNNNSIDKISEPQQKRLYAIALGAGFTVDGLHQFIRSNYNINSTKDILRKDYQAICERVAQTEAASPITFGDSNL